LLSLELRRLRTDILLCFKIVNKHTALDFKHFLKFDSYNKARGHNFKIKTPNFKTTIRQYFVSVRIVPRWNSLPYNLVNCSSVITFKKQLKLLNLSTILDFCTNGDKWENVRWTTTGFLLMDHDDDDEGIARL